jgi:hypothetical protein
MGDHRATALVWALTLAFVSAGCREVPAGATVIDTWPVGDEFRCGPAAPIKTPLCEAMIPAAIAGLDGREPGHAPVVGLTLHHEGGYLDGAGSLILVERSGGCCFVAVLHLEDDATRAIGVGYPGVSTEPVAIPWGP